MADETNKARIDLGADTTDFDTAITRSKRSLADLGAAAGSAGKQASAGLGSVDDELKRGGLSARAYAQALRQVPAQVTDIVTGLASGQRPLTVLLQQGGQLKDVFGGIGPAARALAGYVTSLINPFTLAAAAAAAVGYALNQGEKQTLAFAKALILSGNAAGSTSGQLQEMAAQIAKATGSTQGAASDAVAQLAQTGDVAAANLTKVAAAAVIFERATGTAVKDTVAQFVELGRAPLETSQKLNEALHYLTASEYERIKALDQAGKTTQAATIAQRAYAEAVEVRGRDVLANLGLIAGAWDKISEATKRAIEGMSKALAGPQTLEDRLGAAQAELADRERRGPLNALTQGSFEKGNQSLRDYIALLTQQIYSEREAAVSAKALADQVSARIKFDKDGEQFLTNRAKQEREIAKARNEGVAAGASLAEIEKRVADIRKKYEDKGAARSALAIDKAQLASDIEAYRAASEQFLSVTQARDRILDAQRAAGLVGDQAYFDKKRALILEENAVAEFYLQQEIARAQKEQSLLSGKDAIENLRRIRELQLALAKTGESAATALTVNEIQAKASVANLVASFLSARQAAQEYLDVLQVQQGRSLDFGRGSATREYSAGLDQITDRYSNERRKIENERDLAIARSFEGKLTDEQAREFEQRLRLQDEFQDKSTRAYASWYAKRLEQDRSAGLGLQEAVRNYLDDISKAGKATEQAVGDSLRGLEDELTNLLSGKGFDAKRLVDQIISEFFRLRVIRPLLQEVFGGAGLQGLLGTFSSVLSGSYNANYSHEGLNYPSPIASAAPGGPSALRTAVVPSVFNPAASKASAAGAGGGGVTINASYQIGSNVSRADVVQAVSAGNAQLKADLARQQRRS